MDLLDSKLSSAFNLDQCKNDDYVHKAKPVQRFSWHVCEWNLELLESQWSEAQEHAGLS